ncbi:MULTISPECIES: hypothetical protein [unclassified Microcystis]|jgi:hypothetical protein|uniref:hypothetical protein n=2 Tax=Microcystis TaxID=1125 RepID=UPI002583B955|nr:MULTISPECIES: hypothetical protein [unclassified Microcystis]
MQQVTIELPTTIINALAAYNQEHKVSSSDTVQTAIESFLIAKGYLSKPKKSFHLSPAPKGSGYTDTSINHDAVLAELITNPTLKTRSLLPTFLFSFLYLLNRIY